MLGLTPLLLGIAASAATLTGGVITLRLRSRQGLITGLSAGIVIGVALFDLLPEALSLADPIPGPRYVLSAVAVGLAGCLLLFRLLSALSAQGERIRLQITPATLTLHSFFDGVGIGLGFQLSTMLGWSVALAVLSHDIADGVNIVSVSLDGQDDRPARRWLAINATAPIVGVAAAGILHLSGRQFVPILSALAGIFLYIGASELLPRSQRLDRRIRATGAIVVGLGIVYVVAQLHGLTRRFSRRPRNARASLSLDAPD